MPSIRFSLGWRFLTLPCLLTFFHSVAAAQSFDCAKAKTPTEKLICTHEPLGQLDEELMAAVRGAMPSDPDEKKEFLTEERAWLANRDKECTISERELSEKDRAGALRCLSKSYGDRIKQLRQRKSPVNAAERAAAIPEARSLSEPPPLPYSYGMFTVGDPAEKNTNLGLESAVTDGSDPESQPKTFSYQISCSPNNHDDYSIYRGWRGGPVSEQKTPLNEYYSFSVIYFISDNKTQYMYGMILDQKGFTSGKPVFVKASGWKCSLFCQDPRIDKSLPLAKADEACKALRGN